jgi:hypothetical protein
MSLKQETGRCWCDVPAQSLKWQHLEIYVFIVDSAQPFQSFSTCLFVYTACHHPSNLPRGLQDTSGVLSYVEQRIAAATRLPVALGEAFNVLQYEHMAHYDRCACRKAHAT